jgi:hypothetical protein
MKAKYILFFLLFPFSFFLSPCSAQVPQGFNYQAVARNASGGPIANSILPVKITIQSDSLGGTIFWQELHSSVTTNSQGVINMVIGKGARQTASTVAAFSAIDWNLTPKFIKTEIDYSGWKTMGVSRLWSVPYAMVAGDLAGSVKKLAVEGKTSELEEALFEVKNKDDQTIFAVYNEGVRVYVSDGAKGPKGGFAVGGFGTDKAESQKYLFVTKDSTRVYVDNDPDLKKAKGGFAVGGFDATKGPVTPFVSLDPENYFIGHEAGMNNDTGKYNSFIGYKAGRANRSGNYNIFIGYESGYNNLGPPSPVWVSGNYGSFNCYIGYQTGYSSLHGAHNTFVGYASGNSNTSDNNTFLGSMSGSQNTTGSNNTFIGTETGHLNKTGVANTLMGRWAGWNIVNGNNNTIIGTYAGTDLRSGNSNVIMGYRAMGEQFYAGDGTASSNVIIGFEAGLKALNSSSNIFIGNQAGYNETGSNKLIIENSSSGTPLVFGDFGTDVFRVNGDIEATIFNTVSDVALKQNITELAGVTEKLKLIRGVSFDWNQSGETGLLLKEGRQIGVIAQDVEKVYPELVATNDKGYKMVDYTKLTPILLEAIKEQQAQIESYKAENDDLKSNLQTLYDKVDRIEALLVKSGME